MTVHPIVAPGDNYVRATTRSTLTAATDPRITVSLARIAFREHHHPTYFSDSVASPGIVIKGIVVTREPDRWGNRLFADVEYNQHGHRATYGGRAVDGRIIWQCYMD